MRIRIDHIAMAFLIVFWIVVAIAVAVVLWEIVNMGPPPPHELDKACMDGGCPL